MNIIEKRRLRKASKIYVIKRASMYHLQKLIRYAILKRDIALVRKWFMNKYKDDPLIRQVHSLVISEFDRDILHWTRFIEIANDLLSKISFTEYENRHFPNPHGVIRILLREER